MLSVENETPKILLVDEKPENIAILIHMLKPLNLEIFVALHAKEVFQQVELYDFDLILLGIVMPDVDGYEVCKELKNSSEHKEIPIIFISALNGVEDRIKGFSYGGDDYITKPFVQNELIARIKLHLQKSMMLKLLKQLLRKSYHELYNPLAIINTSLEMQSIKYGKTSYLDAITVASRTLQVVYDDLYYSLSPEHQHTAIISMNLRQFVQKRIDYFYYFKESRDITIDFEADENSDIQMRESDLQRIVDNTLSNAIKYAPEGSSIKIKILTDKEHVVFSSQNRGKTIKNPEKIFNKFYRENYEQTGMGIGLEIVAFICHAYNIFPEVTSKEGVTSFRYTIPKVFN